MYLTPSLTSTDNSSLDFTIKGYPFSTGNIACSHLVLEEGDVEREQEVPR